ncbi:MAG: hypothetical protein K1X85_06625 [Ignavibacteria bacterium]|nr:hypothetical protein [Ignavibacteria bacterium]
MKSKMNLNMKLSKIIAIMLLSFSFAGVVSAQNGTLLDNSQYGIKFNVPSGWKERKVEETSKKDAISYTFDRNDGSIAMMLLAFKVLEVKNLNDLVYTFEKDLTLNIPKREGDYTEFDKGNYDGMSALYKDSEFTEVVYYYRTKVTDGENFAYLLRFIAPSGTFNSSTESELKKIGDSFEPLTAQE